MILYLKSALNWFLKHLQYCLQCNSINHTLLYKDLKQIPQLKCSRIIFFFKIFLVSSAISLDI